MVDIINVVVRFYVDLNFESKIKLIQTLGTKGSQPRSSQWKEIY